MTAKYTLRKAKISVCVVIMGFAAVPRELYLLAFVRNVLENVNVTNSRNNVIFTGKRPHSISIGNKCSAHDTVAKPIM